MFKTIVKFGCRKDLLDLLLFAFIIDRELRQFG